MSNKNLNEIENTNEVNEIETLKQLLKEAQEQLIIEKTKVPTKEKKSCLIFDILARPEGGTLEEVMEATGWQRHSVRGVLSNLQKEQQFTLLNIDVSKPETNGSFIKETKYFIKSNNFELLKEPLLEEKQLLNLNNSL